jgi:hypothetical protein
VASSGPRSVNAILITCYLLAGTRPTTDWFHAGTVNWAFRYT